MGYDCYVRGGPQPQGDDLHGYRLWHDQHPHAYFRRNLSGGSWLADALMSMGMGFDAAEWGCDPGPFPHPEQYGAEYDDEGEPAGAGAEQYREALAKYLAWHGPEIPGIPIHKVCSTNDGWHVTKAECRAALELYEFASRDGKEHPEAFMEDFIPFLREAAARDGFEVF